MGRDSVRARLIKLLLLEVSIAKKSSSNVLLQHSVICTYDLHVHVHNNYVMIWTT